jgi:hypothetical protein
MSCVTNGYSLQFLKICGLQHFAPALATDHIRPVTNSHDIITICVSSLVKNYMPRKHYLLTNPFIYLYLFIYLLIVLAVHKIQNRQVRWLHCKCTKVSRTTSVLVIWEASDPDVHLCHDVWVGKVPDDKDREMILKTMVSWTVNHLMQLLARDNFTEFGRCENFKVRLSKCM